MEKAYLNGLKGNKWIGMVNSWMGKQFRKLLYNLNWIGFDPKWLKQKD